MAYARRAAELLWGTASVEAAEREASANPEVAIRRRHFELRAQSLDAALDLLGANRVLELAAGLSFRGLAMAERAGGFYLDTDLPELVSIKASLVQSLRPASLPGTLRMDALDADAFRAAIRGMPAGPITIIHEGLLMYLEEGEKARLAASVRDALLERGGAGVTADVYVGSTTAVYREETTKAGRTSKALRGGNESTDRPHHAIPIPSFENADQVGLSDTVIDGRAVPRSPDARRASRAGRRGAP